MACFWPSLFVMRSLCSAVAVVSLMVNASPSLWASAEERQIAYRERWNASQSTKRSFRELAENRRQLQHGGLRLVMSDRDWAAAPTLIRQHYEREVPDGKKPPVPLSAVEEMHRQAERVGPRQLPAVQQLIMHFLLEAVEVENRAPGALQSVSPLLGALDDIQAELYQGQNPALLAPAQSLIEQLLGSSTLFQHAKAFAKIERLGQRSLLPPLLLIRDLLVQPDRIARALRFDLGEDVYLAPVAGAGLGLIAAKPLTRPLLGYGGLFHFDASDATDPKYFLGLMGSQYMGDIDREGLQRDSEDHRLGVSAEHLASDAVWINHSVDYANLWAIWLAKDGLWVPTLVGPWGVQKDTQFLFAYRLGPQSNSDFDDLHSQKMLPRPPFAE